MTMTSNERSRLHRRVLLVTTICVSTEALLSLAFVQKHPTRSHDGYSSIALWLHNLFVSSLVAQACGLEGDRRGCICVSAPGGWYRSYACSFGLSSGLHVPIILAS